MEFIALQLNNNIVLISGKVRRKPLRKFALKHFNNAVKAVRVSHSFQSVQVFKKKALQQLEDAGRMSSTYLASHLKFRDVCMVDNCSFASVECIQQG